MTRLQQLALLITLTVMMASHPGWTSPPSSKEKEIIETIQQNREQQIKLLEQLVNINSSTNNIPGVRQVGGMLQKEFANLGFKTRWVEEPPGMHRAPTLIAERKGTGGKSVLLIGHLDTVFPQSSSEQTFMRRGDKATGPGVIDDKGGDVIILYALKALHETHALDNTSITVILTGDEENAGKPVSISRKPLIDAAKNSDAALDFEWAITPDTASIARRGIAKWTLETSGNEAHSSEIFQKQQGYGAVFEMARILDKMRATLAGERYLTFNPGLILGGSTTGYDDKDSRGTAAGKNNVIAKRALASGDLRYLTSQQKLVAEKQIKNIVRHHLPGTSASVSFEEGIPAMPPRAGNLALLKMYSQASIDSGNGPIRANDPGLRGAGDISHAASLVPANLVGLGALGTGAIPALNQLN